VSRPFLFFFRFFRSVGGKLMQLLDEHTVLMECEKVPLIIPIWIKGALFSLLSFHSSLPPLFPCQSPPSDVPASHPHLQASNK
jgi:hypothetical protein